MSSAMSLNIERSRFVEPAFLDAIAGAGRSKAHS